MRAKFWAMSPTLPLTCGATSASFLTRGACRVSEGNNSLSSSSRSGSSLASASLTGALFDAAAARRRSMTTHIKGPPADGVLQHLAGPEAGVADDGDVLALPERVGPGDPQRLQVGLDGEKGQVALGVLVEQLGLQRRLAALIGRDESDLQVGDEFVV